MPSYSPLKNLKGEADTPAMAHRNTVAYRATERAGRRAETLTKFLYFLTRYICVATHQKIPFGELGLNLRPQQTVLILKVIYRQHSDNPESGILNARQIARMRKAGGWMMARHYALKNKQIHLRLIQWSG